MLYYSRVYRRLVGDLSDFRFRVYLGLFWRIGDR